MARKRYVRAALLLALLTCAFFWKVVFRGELLSANDFVYFFPPWSEYRPSGLRSPSNLQLADHLLEFYPFHFFSREAFRSGHVPLWNPHIYAGFPFLADTVSAVFYPLNLMFHILPVPVAFSASAMARIFLAGLFMYLFARAVALSYGGSLLAAVAFMFCSFNIAWLGHPHTNVSILLPLLLLLTERLLSGPYPLSVFALAACVGVHLLGGHVETSFHITIVAAVYLLSRLIEAYLGGRDALWLRRRLLGFVAAHALGFLLAALVLLPFLELLWQSRTLAERSAPEGNLPFELKDPRSLIVLLIPNFFGNPAHNNWWGEISYLELGGYVGVMPFLLALFALAFGLKDKRVLFCVALALFSAIMVLRIEPFFSLINALPLFKQTINFRLVLAYQFALALLAGIGMDLLISEGERRRKLAILFVLAAAAFFSALAILSFRYMEIKAPARWTLRNYMADNIRLFAALSAASLSILTLALTDKAKRAAVALALALTFADLFHFRSDFFPAVKPDDVLPVTPESVSFLSSRKDISRMAAIGEHTFLPNLPMLYGLYDVRGFDFPLGRHFADFFKALIGGVSDRWGSYRIRHLDDGNLRFLSLLNVKYVMSPKELPLRLPDLELVYDKEVKIYRNRAAFPRAFIVHSIERVGSESEALLKLQDRSLDLRQLAVISEDMPEDELSALKGGPASGQAAITSYQPNRVKIKAVAQQPGILVLADAYYGGWQVKVDGVKRKIYRVNYILRGVFLERGEHQIEFVYSPLSFKAGLALSGLALVVIILGGWKASRLESILAPQPPNFLAN